MAHAYRHPHQPRHSHTHSHYDENEEEQEQYEQQQQDVRRHSLSQSVLEFEEEEEEQQYEDSDFGTVPLHQGGSGGAGGAHNLENENPEVDPSLQVHEAAHAVRGNQAPFLTSPWTGEAFDPTKPTPIAIKGFIASPRTPEENNEQRNVFALPKSKTVSAQVLELAGRPGTYEQLVNLLLIRDTFEPFAVDINYSDPSGGDTPLMRACHGGLLDVVQLLYECTFNWVLGYPIDVDKVDFLGATALMKAAQSGHLVICKYLLEVLHARVNIKDYDGWNALMFAASKGHWHIVEYLVQAWDADVLDCSLQQDTPLMLAANNGYLNVVRYLVEHTEAGEVFDDQAEEERRRAEEEAALAAAEEEDDEDEEDEEEKEDDEDESDEEEVQRRRDEARAKRKQAKTEALKLQILQRQQQRLQPKTVLGLEQINQRGWTALLGAAHYGQLYVVHYLVSRGANPDIRDHEGRSARDVPMSLLAQNRFGTPVVQPQVLAAIEAGLVDYNKNIQAGGRSRNVKRSAVERALVRFKRAERYMIDAERARSTAGQFEIAHILFGYACDETRANKLVREEMELRDKARQAADHSAAAHKHLLAYRLKFVKDTLQAEAQRNFFLAERYMAEKSYQVAVQCLSVCLQYEPDNSTYQSKLASVRQQQTRATNTSAADAAAASAPPPSDTADEEGEDEDEEDEDEARRKKNKAKEKDTPAPTRTCTLFGFSFF